MDVNHPGFLSPDNMSDTIREYCKNTGQKIPETIGEISSVIYHSLAESYAKTVAEIEELTQKVYDKIYIIGAARTPTT